MIDFFIKIAGFFIDFFWPGKLKELQIKVSRLDLSNLKEIQDFMELYEETFPYTGDNYAPDELLEFLEDMHNSKKHVKSDNILLIAKFKDKVIAFIACFYYPQRQYGIIGYYGKTALHKEEGKYVGVKLLKKLKDILVIEYGCKLLVFELESNQSDKAKAFLFKKYAKKFGLSAFELDFEYLRPKLNLEDSKESKLTLMIVPIENEAPRGFLSKEKVIDILNFIHFYCYGDYYDSTDEKFSEFQQYMKSRMAFYEISLANEIPVK